MIALVDLTGSELALVWRTDAVTARIRAFAAAATRYARGTARSPA